MKGCRRRSKERFNTNIGKRHVRKVWTMEQIGRREGWAGIDTKERCTTRERDEEKGRKDMCKRGDRRLK